MKKIVLYNTEGSGNEVEQAYLDKRGLKDYQLVRIDGEDEEFFAEAEDADGVVIVYLQANENAFARLEKCKVLATQCIGVNNIDLSSATEHGVFVGNVPDYCVEEVAVHTVSMMLSGIRCLKTFHESVQDGNWNPQSGGQIRRVSGMVYGLAAFGNIPRKIVELMKPFGVEFRVYDPYCSDQILEEYGVARVESLEELFQVSDYLSVHIPLLDNTENIINDAILGQAKPGMILVVTGRGGVVDEYALREKLIEGRIRMAGIDVIANESDVSSPLFGMEQVVISPHVAYYSEEAIIECREKAIMQIVEVLEDGKTPTYLVNKEMLKRGV